MMKLKCFHWVKVRGGKRPRWEKKVTRECTKEKGYSQWTDMSPSVEDYFFLEKLDIIRMKFTWEVRYHQAVFDRL